ncbi:terpene synthase family protein [Paraburkholderia caffeinilytica]|uniref:terpene synthase family protein n=1 Tax=Paraburkholderia caffeinilytica TaxID=1761016 RepID=UPI003DA1A919
MEKPASTGSADSFPHPELPPMVLIHVRQSPYSGVLENEVIAWMHEWGLLDDREKLDRVKNMDVGKYAGFSYPNGAYEDTLLYAKYITLWLLWDDFVVEKHENLKEVGKALHRIFSCSVLPGPFRENGYMLAWRNIVSDLRDRNDSQEFFDRLAESMRIWVRTADLERRSVGNAVTGGFGKYLNRRMITIGMIPTAQLLETFAGTKLSDSRAIRGMVRVACRIVGIANELVSFSKDTNWINLVNVCSQINGCGVHEARIKLIVIHNKSVQSLERMVRLSSGDIRTWGESLQYCAEGFSYWHTVCPRYAGSNIGADVIDRSSL